MSSEYAKKEDVDNVVERVVKLEHTVDTMAGKLDAILNVLVRIAWLLATPIIIGVGYAAIATITQGVPPLL